MWDTACNSITLQPQSQSSYDATTEQSQAPTYDTTIPSWWYYGTWWPDLFTYVKAPACQQPSQILIAKCEFSHNSFSLESWNHKVHKNWINFELIYSVTSKELTLTKCSLLGIYELYFRS